MESQVIAKYCQMIDRIEERLMKKNDYKTKRDQEIKTDFNTHFKGEIQKLFKIKIIRDNDLAGAINRKAEDITKTYKKQFKRSQEKMMFLVALNRIAYDEKFICKRQFNVNKQKLDEIKNQSQFRLNSELDILIAEENRKDFRETLFYLIRKETDINLDDDLQVMKIYQQFYKKAIKNYDRKLVVKIDQIISKFQKKQELLSEELQLAIDEYLGTEVGKDDQQIQLNKLLAWKAEAESLSSNQNHLAKMNQQYQYLKGILNKFCSMKLITHDLKLKLHLAVFGSNVSGFASKNTDMDLAILTNCFINQMSFLKYLHKFMDAQFKEKDKNSYKLELVDARIPLIKLKFINQELQFHFDIIINNILGVINSKFLAVYGQISWIKYLVILVKQWGKHQGLVSENLFSSYGLTLMVLHFLIQTSRVKLIMDSRLRQTDAPNFLYRRHIRGTNEQFKVFYEFKTKPKDVTSLKRVSLYEILREFFQYYYDGEDKKGKHWELSEEQRIISVDGGVCEYDSNYIFTIKDPFDEKHNPGRVKQGQKNKIMGKFNRAIHIMKGKIKQDIQNLFGEYNL